MAKTTTNPFTQTVKSPGVAFVNADSFTAANGGTAPTNTKLLFTAGTEGSVLKSLVISSDDSSARTISFYISTDAGTTKLLLGTVSVAAGSGLTSGTTVNVDVLNNLYLNGLVIDQSGRQVLPLEASARIYAGLTIAAVTSGRTLHVTGVAEDF